MIALAANKSIIKSKLKKELLVNFDLMIEVTTSWSNIIEQIRSHEKV
jgi:hypothetical protein